MAIEDDAQVLANKCLSDLWQLGVTKSREQDAHNYHMNAIPFQQAAWSDLDAVKQHLRELEVLVIDYGGQINKSYYSAKIKSIKDQIKAYEKNLPTPQIDTAIADSEVLEGVVELVDDGDTVFIDGKEIRFAGIDAPEVGTIAGIKSKEFLESLVLNQRCTLRIDPHNPIDVYGRVLGVLYKGTENINKTMVENCMAEVNGKFGRHKYVDQNEMKFAAKDCTLTWPGYGIIKVYSKPTNADIWVDGVLADRETPAEIELPVGPHTLMAVTIDTAPDIREIEVLPGKREVRLYPTKMPVSTGLVEVYTYTNGGTVTPMDFITDTGMTGITPALFETDLATHSITVYYNNQEKTETFVPVAGRRVTIKIEF